MTDFKKSYTPGTDLIYGIGEQIDRYIIHHLTGKEKENLSTEETKLAREKKSDEYFAINTFNKHLTNAEYDKQASQKQKVYIDAFRGSSFKSSYSPTMAAVSKTKLQKIKKSNVHLNPKSPNDIRAAAHDFAIRRSCKFGIEYTTNTLNGKIHYVLDGMDLGAIAAKNVQQRWRTNNSGFTKIPICTSELRYLFRNWQKFDKSDTVIFWEKFALASPPWQRSEWEDDWKAYAIERICKYWGQIHSNSAGYKLTRLFQNQADKIKSAEDAAAYLKGVNSKEVIARFHRIPVDLTNKEALETN